MIRTRFAPSPTGHLHVGGARTALFNYLYAKSKGGKFILRIEDTDQERSTTESEKLMLESMRWLGLDWDEGPGKEGDYGPYVQSQRLDIYHEIIDSMLVKGLAYKCFCTADELDRKKEIQEKEGKAIIYDGTCRNLSVEKIKQKEEQGLSFTVRFKSPRKQVIVEDLVQGRVEFDTSILGDFIIVKSDGFPTYNFAVVVDDHHMRISHVIRGVGHLSNTPKQVLIYEALGYELPSFAHVSQIVGPDRKKLSKRHGATSLGEYAQEGYLPEAFFNYIAFLGWSSPDGEEFVRKSDLEKVFDLDRCGKSDAVFDTAKLRWLNGKYLRDYSQEELLLHLKPYLDELQEKMGIDLSSTQEAKDKIAAILDLGRDYLEVLSDVKEFVLPFYEEDAFPESEEAYDWISTAEGIELLKLLQKKLEQSGSLSKENFFALLKESGKETNLKGKALFAPARIGITGKIHGPDLPLLYTLLGHEKVLSRLKKNAERGEQRAGA